MEKNKKEEEEEEKNERNAYIAIIFFNSDGMLFFPFNIELISLRCQVGTVILMHTNTFLSCNLN